MLKKKLHYSINSNNRIIDKTFNHFFDKQKQKKIFKSFYLSIDQIKKINKMGMKIGSHGHSHKLLSNLSFKNQYIDILKGRNFLEKYYT